MQRNVVVVLVLLVTACATSPSTSQGGVSTASSLQTRTEEAVERQDWDTAGTLGAELTQREPENARGWLMLGIALLGQGKHADAVAALERSVALKDSAQARYNIGIALAQMGKVQDALTHFERAVELKPDYGLGWKSVAKARAAVGRFPEASKALREAKRLRPDDPEVDALAFQLAQVLELKEAPAQDAPLAEVIRARDLLAQRVASVAWTTRSAQVADVTLDGVADVVLLGERAGSAVVAVVAGPLTPKTKHWTLIFEGGPGTESGLCAPPGEALLSLESPELPLDEWGCSGDAPSKECKRAVAVNDRLVAARKNKGTRGVRLNAGECDAHHIYFDGDKLQWWRR